MKSPDLEAMIKQIEHDSFNCINCGKHISEHAHTLETKGGTYLACVRSLGQVSDMGSFNGQPIVGEMFVLEGRYEKAEH